MAATAVYPQIECLDSQASYLRHNIASTDF